jgi:hypothetical protein
VEIAQKGNVFVQINNVGRVTWRAALSEHERHAKPDALSSVRVQSPRSSGLLIDFGKPFIPLLRGSCQFTKLDFGIRYFCQFSDCCIEVIYLSRLVSQKQVCKCVSGDQRHRLGTEPTPLSQQAFNIQVIDTKPVLYAVHRVTRNDLALRSDLSTWQGLSEAKLSLTDGMREGAGLRRDAVRGLAQL